MGKARKGTVHPGLYKRGRYWWISRDPVEGRAISTRCTDLKAAKIFQAERERLGADPTNAAAATTLLGGSCERWLAMRERSGARAVTVGFWRTKLGHWIRLHGNDAPLLKLASVSVWDEYFAARKSEGASNHTIAKETRVMRQVLASEKRAGRFPVNPEELKPEGLTTSYTPKDRALTVAEAAALLPVLRPVPQALCAIAIATGARLSEAANLTPEDVDLKAGLIHIRGTKTKGSNRTIPILSPFRGLIVEVLPLLPIGVPNNLRRDFLQGCKKAGIAPATMNDFRRSHASILAELGASQAHTADLLGHSTEAMVRRIYRKPRAEAVGQLIESSIVANVKQLPALSGKVTEAKSPESKRRGSRMSTYSGFLSRRSQVQILPGAPKKRIKREDGFGVSQACSGLTLPLFSLVLAFESAGEFVDPSPDSLLRAAVRMGVAP